MALSSAFAARYPLSLLLVEDNLVNLKLADRILSKLGYQADHARDGEEGANKILDKARREGRSYDIVLLDLQMPNTDGSRLRRSCSGSSGAATSRSPR